MNQYARKNKEWRKECEYLAQLLERGVGAQYREIFRVQAAGATRQRFYALATTLAEIADDEMSDERAIVALRAHAAALAPAAPQESD